MVTVRRWRPTEHTCPVEAMVFGNARKNYRDGAGKGMWCCPRGHFSFLSVKGLFGFCFLGIPSCFIRSMTLN